MSTQNGPIPCAGSVLLPPPSLMTADRSLFGRREDAYEPLASRLRPTTLEGFLGQEHIVGVGRPLRQAIERGEVTSIVLWGPPGSGKTTLAHIIATYTDRHFEPFSAVTSGVPQVREIIKQAQLRQEYEGKGTILFCDEIHRFNKAQQDAFLPWVERGVITLIGATTENPSFELNSALLSRLRVFVLEPLGEEHVRTILEKAMREEGGVGSTPEGGLSLEEEATQMLVKHADGDARIALNTLEAILDHVHSSSLPPPPSITAETVALVLERRIPRYDKAGESHYNLISALHKAVRGSDVEGALYWLARMISAGEDPLYLARRVVRMASEDVGLADPRALSIAVAAKDSYHFLGSPEGELAVAEAVVYLATAPKSNRVYEAWDRALDAAREHPNEPVPLHIRNAPTGLMKDLGYGKGYKYDHAKEDGLAVGQEYLPEVLRGSKWYEPTERGFEKTVGQRLEWWEAIKARSDDSPDIG